MSPSRWLALITALGLLYPFHSSGAATPEIERPALEPGAGACTPTERWSLGHGWIASNGGETVNDVSDAFRGTIRKNSAPVIGFSEALALRESARTRAQRAFAEYWVSRALFDAKLPHVAWSGFNAILSEKTAEDNGSIQIAALACVLEIRARYPSFALDPALFESGRLKALRAFTNDESVDHAALILLMDDPRTDHHILSLMDEAGPFRSFGEAIIAARSERHEATISALKAFFSTNPLPAALSRYLDSAHLLYARAFYATGGFESAAIQIKHVRKNSNELASSLSELSWAYFMDEKYNEAIGSAMNLQTGGLRKVFSPEAPMVMAMALNEICQYPESIRAIQNFRKNYESSFRFLSEKMPESPYRLAVDFLQKRSTGPARVLSEWVRSPVFISNQDEINLLLQERDSLASLTQSGKIEQRNLALDLVKRTKELRPRVRFEKSAFQKSKSGGEFRLSRNLRYELDLIKRRLRLFRKLSVAAPTWRAILATRRESAPALEHRLIATINRDLSAISRRMRIELQEVAENTQLIEVEIFNGASHDMIWQNAHPDYQAFAQKLKEAQNKNEAGQVWDWGRISVAGEDESEIWEDELGSFRADLEDNCGSKDKFVALMTKGDRR